MSGPMSVVEAIALFRSMKTQVEMAAAIGVRAGSMLILGEARAIVGAYQRQDTGPFAAWDELAARTKIERVSLGYTENDPGLRSGAMRDSYGVRMAAAGAVAVASVGSDMPEAVWFERGTRGAGAMAGDDYHQPPRAVLGVAAFREEHQVVEGVVMLVLTALRGETLPGVP